MEDTSDSHSAAVPGSPAAAADGPGEPAELVPSERNALVPFSYASPFHDSLKLEERLFSIEGVDLRVRQSWKADGKGGSKIGFGASVYGGAFVLAHWLGTHGRALLKGARVVELGAGLGLTGIAAARLGAAHVALTDGDDELLELTRANLARNTCAAGPARCRLGRCDAAPLGGASAKEGGAEAKDAGGAGAAALAAADARGDATTADDAAPSSECACAGVQVAPLLWGAEGAAASPVLAPRSSGGAGAAHGDAGEGGDGGFDLVVGADIVAVPYEGAYRDLVWTLKALCTTYASRASAARGRGPAAVIAYKRREAGEARFWHMARAAGFEVTQLPEDQVHPDFRGHAGITLQRLQLKAKA